MIAVARETEAPPDRLQAAREDAERAARILLNVHGDDLAALQAAAARAADTAAELASLAAMRAIRQRQ